MSRWTPTLASDSTRAIGTRSAEQLSAEAVDVDVPGAAGAGSGPSPSLAVAVPEWAPSAPEREARLKALFDTHYDFVWRVLRRMTSDPSEADDAAQEVFMIALSRLERIVPGCERSFLYGIALRLSKNAGRRRARNQAATADPAAELVSDEPLPDAALELLRRRRHLDSILARMPAPVARVVVLAEIEQLSAQEIAGLEEIPVGTVASRLRKGRELVRRCLERERRPRRGGGP